jgi:hypothetical protein
MGSLQLRGRHRRGWTTDRLRAIGVLASDIGAVLHRERLAGGKKRLHPLSVAVDELPDGAMVQQDGESFLILQGHALLWSPAGYHAAPDAIQGAMLLTPPSTLRAMSAGYRPVLHRSAIAESATPPSS